MVVIPLDVNLEGELIEGPNDRRHGGLAEAKPMYRTVKTSRLFEQIVQQVEESILKGQLKPGDQLPAERDLAQRFGVSRTAVREAVKTLREKGLVEAYSGRGTFVTNGTSQAIRQSLDLMIRINQQEGLGEPGRIAAGAGAGDCRFGRYPD